MPFDPGDAARQHHDLDGPWGALRHVPAPGQGLDPLPGDRLGRERVEVDAAGDHPQPVVSDAVALADVGGDVLRHRDHPVASRHDAVVAVLEKTRAAAIDAVEGGDERDAAALRGIAAAPGGGARMRMDQLHALLLRKALQPADVGPDHQRVLGVHRQLDGCDAEVAKLALAAPAARGHDRRPAMRDQVAREVDRVALGAALAEPRQDLQDTRPRSGLVPVRRPPRSCRSSWRCC